MRELKYPALYKHFKDKHYAVMGLSRPSREDDILLRGMMMYARCTETDTRLIIHVSQSGEWVHSKHGYDHNLVLYKSLYDDTGIYTRSLDMFLSEVDKLKYPNIEQKYRFEEIK